MKKRLTLLLIAGALILQACTWCIDTPRGVRCLECEGGTCWKKPTVTIYCKFPPRPSP